MAVMAVAVAVVPVLYIYLQIERMNQLVDPCSLEMIQLSER